MIDKIYSTEVFFTPDWHPSFSRLMGDITGESGYITEFGTVRLLGKQDIEVSKFETESLINGATKLLTACSTRNVL